ncbi:MAG TPA: helix-turn-helix domain-containing protein [Vicinamibacterales bacterium]|nr:helix-turn-helix domain-containing protein [Vicinamibacterales bacterium]
MMCSELHERLRAARERKGLSLARIARERGVREQNLELIERDAFEDLPTGLYGRNAVRSYAAAVGLSPEDALAEVAHRLREPEDPIDGLARVRGIERPRPRRTVEVAPSVARPARLPIAWRPQAAALIDSGILIGLDLALLELTALVAGVRMGDVLRLALPAMLMLFALIGGLYFVLLGGIGRATIGAQLVQAPQRTDDLEGAGVHAVVHRGLRCALAEGSSLVTWMSTAGSART